MQDPCLLEEKSLAHHDLLSFVVKGGAEPRISLTTRLSFISISKGTYSFFKSFIVSRFPPPSLVCFQTIPNNALSTHGLSLSTWF